MKANWIFDKFDICRLLPILQILEVIDEIRLLEVASLCQEIQIIWIPKTLYKFQLCLESKSFFFLLITMIMWRLMLKLSPSWRKALMFGSTRMCLRASRLRRNQVPPGQLCDFGAQWMYTLVKNLNVARKQDSCP